MKRELTHLSLFSGIGGLDLAAEMAGIRTVGQCEWADFQTKILERHWADVPRWRDIRTLTKESFYERTGLRTVDIISGGFPCQPFSVAGKRNGKDDDRYLWDEMFRVIKEIKPTWVIGENVPGIINLALDTVLSDLESEGFETQPFVIPACGVDAPHRRNRVCIIAHRDNRHGIDKKETVCTGRNAAIGMDTDVSDSDNGCRTMRRDGELQSAQEATGMRTDNGGREKTAFTGERWENEPGVSRMDDGLPESVYTASSDTEGECSERIALEKLCGGGANYKNRLEELLECTPLGIIGRTNPEYVEWLMGYPIGWTELSHSETP